MANNRMMLKCLCDEEFVIASGMYPWAGSMNLNVEGSKGFDAWLEEHTACASNYNDVPYGNGLPTHFKLEYEVPGKT